MGFKLPRNMTIPAVHLQGNFICVNKPHIWSLNRYILIKKIKIKLLFRDTKTVLYFKMIVDLGIRHLLRNTVGVLLSLEYHTLISQSDLRTRKNCSITCNIHFMLNATEFCCEYKWSGRAYYNLADRFWNFACGFTLFVNFFLFFIIN